MCLTPQFCVRWSLQIILSLSKIKGKKAICFRNKIGVIQRHPCIETPDFQCKVHTNMGMAGKKKVCARCSCNTFENVSTENVITYHYLE